MKISFRKSNDIIGMINMSLINLPTPSSISYMWNFGSLLGIFLGIQILTGLFLSMQFSAMWDLSFNMVVHMMRDVNMGWLIRVLHANGASFFFLFMYLHIGRGLYYGSYRFKGTWMSGVTIFLLSMATAFLGYVLPWGQMSFWAATVITNLLSAIPYFGKLLVEWVWGGFAVSNPTLIRFFTFHFILPFIIMFVVLFHLVFLHYTGSSNPMGLNSNLDKIEFYPFFVISDLYGLFFFLVFLFYLCLQFPFVFMDVENFIYSNPMVTPVHIQPEWYFLFAYTILRSISSKIGGVIALLFSVLLLYFLPFIYNHRFRSNYYYYFNKIFYWFMLFNWLLLTWIGACEVEYPFDMLGAFFSLNYFLMFFVLWVLYSINDLVL